MLATLIYTGCKRGFQVAYLLLATVKPWNCLFYQAVMQSKYAGEMAYSVDSVQLEQSYLILHYAQMSLFQ